MKKIFIGMLMVFLDFNLDINAMRIGLIPDFIGYIFMFRGLSELAEFSDKFTKIKPYVIGMAIYSGISYIFDIMGTSISANGYFNLIIGLISTIVSLYISYIIITGVEDIELSKMVDLNYSKLQFAWKLLAVTSLTLYLAILDPVLAFIWIFAGLIIAIYYLYVFNNTKNLFYENYPKA